MQRPLGGNVVAELSHHSRSAVSAGAPFRTCLTAFGNDEALDERLKTAQGAEEPTADTPTSVDDNDGRWRYHEPWICGDGGQIEDARIGNFEVKHIRFSRRVIIQNINPDEVHT